MRMSKLTLLSSVLFLASCCTAQEKTEKTPEFPNIEEIQLVVTQSERVFEQYKQAVTTEAELPTSKTNPSMIEKDRGVYDMATKLIASLKAHPQGFHGVGGPLLLSSLDDASRNAALCSGAAYNDTMDALMTKSDVHSAKDWIHVGLSCVDVSGYLYTVSESVQAMLVRDMQAQQMLNQRAGETINTCTAALKKCSQSNK
jgi:hypothetical protein